ncbi:MAG TPA: cysteine hydrolase [Alphaproteobacteria bacterium]|nr:cysteine hydrolase [Alphaproteobacteria bacterium]
MRLKGALGADTLHIVLDMQRLFVEHPDWSVPELPKLVPPILRLIGSHPHETLFTRFVTPRRAEDAHGQWRYYYRRWQSVTLSHMDPALLDLVPPLARHARPDSILDKRSHGGWEDPAFVKAIGRRRASTLVLTGVETDVCVLAFALGATDRGYRVIIVEDAVASSSPAGHHAALEAIYPRLDQQIQIASLEGVLAAWPDRRAE